MTEGNGGRPGNGSSKVGDPAGERQFLLQQLYIKDLSFEVPRTPGSFGGQAGEPDVKLNLRNSHTRLDEQRYEVVLHINVHAKINEQSVFMIELDQAGVFFLQGYNEEDSRRLLGIYCPNTLFPYAREAVSSIVGRGGFPPLVLQPINFDALYAQANQQRAEQA